MQWLITAPANNERGPRYMEKALAAIHQAGLRQTPVTLVYGAVGGEIGVLLSCARAQQELVLGPIAANYAQCSVAVLYRDFFRRYHRLAAYFARNITRGRARWLAWFLERMAGNTPSPSRTALETSTSRLHEREEDLQAAADKIGGHLFEARIRLIAATPPDRRIEAHDRLRSMAGALQV